MPPRYDSAADPSAFLLAYEEAALEARGDDKIMANLFPLALASEPRTWLLNFLGSMMTSSGELRGLFTTRYAALAHHAVADLLGGSQAPPSDRHIKPFLRQIGATSKRPGLRRVGLCRRPTSPSTRKTTPAPPPAQGRSRCSARPPSAT